MNHSFTTTSAQETQDLANMILHECIFKHPHENTTMNKNIVLLFGDLGSGKTTFVKGLGKALGIPENITSPSYTYRNNYRVPINNDQKLLTIDQLIHFDLYRLPDTMRDPDTVSAEIGLTEAHENPNNLVVIEWPERLPISSKSTLQLHFIKREKDHSIELKT